MSQKGLIPVIIVVLIALLAASGYFIYQKQVKIAPSLKQTTNHVNAPTSEFPILPNNNSVDRLTFLQNGDVAIFNLKTQQTQKLTNYGYNTSPIISPDNSKIAYLSVPEAVVKSGKVQKFPGSGFFDQPISYEREYNVWIINVDGSNPVQVTSHPKKRTSITWSADSNKIAFEEEGSIVEYSLSNKTKTTIAINGKNPVYSSISSYIAYLMNDGKTIVIKLGSKEKRIDRSDRVSNLNWSQSEDKLFYTSLNQKDQKGTSSLGVKFSIWIYSLANGIEKQITDEQMNISNPTVSPNNSYIAANQGSGYADAGNIDLSFVLLRMNNDLTIAKQLKLDEFKGPDFFEKEKQFMFPFNTPIWLNEKEVLVKLDELLEPKPNPRGLYKLNVENLTAERLFEFTIKQ